jgi:CheY-like chemotaxis protein
MQFKKAVKTQSKLRMALIGPAGSGKTYTALNIAQHLGERVALIDTEHGSASKYADVFTFDVLELTSFSPQMYIEAIHAAEAAGYQVLIIDSLSHAWIGAGGALEMVDKVAKKSQSSNTFAAWRDVTPLHNQLVETMLACDLHLIVTMRSKMEYAVEKDEKTNKIMVRKIGLAPVQRDGLEYEFDVTADLTLDNEMIVSKTRCPALKGQMISMPGQEVADTLREWLAGEVVINTAENSKRTALEARFGEIAGQLLALGQNVEIDDAWIKAASDDELIAEGKRLKALLQQAQTAQTELPVS